MCCSPRALISLAGMLVAIAIGLTIWQLRLPAANRQPAHRERAMSAAPPDDTASLPLSRPTGGPLEIQAQAGPMRRKEFQSRAQGGSATQADQSAGGSHRTSRARRTGVMDAGKRDPDISVGDPLLEVATVQPVLRGPAVRLPLFFTLDEEKIAAMIPGVTVAGLKVLRQKFEEEAGVGVLPVDDPVYAERWKQAELTLEQKMRLWYGWAAWGAFEHQAALQANAMTDLPSAP